MIAFLHSFLDYYYFTLQSITNLRRQSLLIAEFYINISAYKTSQAQSKLLSNAYILNRDKKYSSLRVNIIIVNDKNASLFYNSLDNLFQMARNCEKAQGMLNRWWSMKRALVNKEDDERPKGIRHIRDITDLYQCQKWRKQVTSNIIEKVEEIQNRARPQNQIRALNDDINRLLRQLYYWEIRIKELGGNDYRAIKNAKMYDAQGREIPGFGGYRYFGAAKDLPGVKEVYRRQIPIAPQKTVAQLRKSIDVEYFGDAETLDGSLLEEQKKEEESKREEDLIRWMQQNKKKIEQFFKGKEYTFDELVQNIDNIQDFQVQVQQQIIKEQIISNDKSAQT